MRGNYGLATMVSSPLVGSFLLQGQQRCLCPVLCQHRASDTKEKSDKWVADLDKDTSSPESSKEQHLEANRPNMCLSECCEP